MTRKNLMAYRRDHFSSFKDGRQVLLEFGEKDSIKQEILFFFFLPSRANGKFCLTPQGRDLGIEEITALLHTIYVPFERKGLNACWMKFFFFFYEWEHRMVSMCPFSSLHPLRKGKER